MSLTGGRHADRRDAGSHDRQTCNSDSDCRPAGLRPVQLAWLVGSVLILFANYGAL